MSTSSYLYRTIESKEKMLERVETLNKAKIEMERIAENDFADNTEWRITGWNHNEIEYDYLIPGNAKEEMTRILAENEKGNTQGEKVRAYAENGKLVVKFFFSYA